MLHRTVLLSAVLGWVLAGCNTEPDEPEVSNKARVVPKPGVVWGRDLAAGLGLAAWDLCRELGSIDCIEGAHQITLGGVEPTRLGIDEPIADPSVSSPIAVDRVAMSACSERYRLDAEGDPVLFGPVLANNSEGKRREVSEQLVRRLLARQPKDTEIDALLALYADIEPVADDAVRDWSIGACMVVATSTEALFY